MRRFRNFRRGEGGGPGLSNTKSSDVVFFLFLSPQLILQKSNGQFQRNLSFLKVPEGVQHCFDTESNTVIPDQTAPRAV